MIIKCAEKHFLVRCNWIAMLIADSDWNDVLNFWTNCI